jgi:hypothetical protein
MNRATILPLVFLFTTTGAIAQNAVTPDSLQTTSLTHLRTPGAYCPVGLLASHGSSLPVAMNAYGDVRPQTGPAINGRRVVPQVPAPALYQRIHLTMINHLSREIVSARFTVHGYSDKPKAIELAGVSQGPDLSKTVNVVLDVKASGHASSDLSLSRFTAVTSIDLNSIIYADGTTWHVPSPGACSVTPDSLMLVAATR